MIPLTLSAKKKAMLYLTEDVSNTADLAKKLDCDLADAEEVEIGLVTETLLVRSPGFYQNPRFYLTDNGLAFLGMVGARTPLDPQAILTKIKTAPEDASEQHWGAFYAGTRLQVYQACMTLVALGLATTEDGGATFALVE